jgi:hypothetical protein
MRFTRAARVIRSKNAELVYLTIDLIFPDQELFDMGNSRKAYHRRSREKRAQIFDGHCRTRLRTSFRVYRRDGFVAWPESPSLPREIFAMIECIAPAADQVKTVLPCCKQYPVHQGFRDRLSTASNIPPPPHRRNVLTGTTYRFGLYQIMQVDALPPLFPIVMETL